MLPRCARIERLSLSCQWFTLELPDGECGGVMLLLRPSLGPRLLGGAAGFCYLMFNCRLRMTKWPCL